ncbi:hypothetical protein GCM10028784_06650 [Myceligenerans cantabricum]
MADSPGAHPHNGARTLRCPGPVAVPANDTMPGLAAPSAPTARSSARPSGAKEWIAGYLAARGDQVLAGEVIEAGGALGFPASTVKNARRKVADTFRVGFGRAQQTYWRLRAAPGTSAETDPIGTAGLTDTAEPVPAARPVEPASAARPTRTARTAKRAGPVRPTDAAAPSGRASRPRRRPARRPTADAVQPTLFAVMGVSES